METYSTEELVSMLKYNHFDPYDRNEVAREILRRIFSHATEEWICQFQAEDVNLDAL